MPLYFSEVAPQCPISTDSSTGPRERHLFNRPTFTRSTIPRLPGNANLNDVVLVANIARSIVSQITNNRVRNNVYNPKNSGRVSVAKDKFKNTKARWTEQKDKRVKKKYKYYGVDQDGNENKDTYVTMERIERMVWYDKGWKSYLIWEYGDKGEGDPIT
jgi:hypothetical protein